MKEEMGPKREIGKEQLTKRAHEPEPELQIPTETPELQIPTETPEIQQIIPGIIEKNVDDLIKKQEEIDKRRKKEDNPGVN